MKKEVLYRVFSHLPELLTDRLTLRKLASFPQSAYLQPHLEELDKELQAIE